MKFLKRPYSQQGSTQIASDPFEYQEKAQHLLIIALIHPYFRDTRTSCLS